MCSVQRAERQRGQDNSAVAAANRVTRRRWIDFRDRDVDQHDQKRQAPDARQFHDLQNDQQVVLRIRQVAPGHARHAQLPRPFQKRPQRRHAQAPRPNAPGRPQRQRQPPAKTISVPPCTSARISKATAPSAGPTACAAKIPIQYKQAAEKDDAQHCPLPQRRPQALRLAAASRNGTRATQASQPQSRCGKAPASSSPDSAAAPWHGPRSVGRSPGAVAQKGDCDVIAKGA